MLPGLLLDPFHQGVLEQFGEPEVQVQVPRTVREPLPGPDQDFVQEVIHRHLAAVKQTLMLQDSQLAASMVAQAAEVRAEQSDEVLPMPVLLVPLQLGPGRAQVGPAAGFALEEIVLADALLVLLDLRDERVCDAVQGDLRVPIFRLGRQRPGGESNDGPGLVPRGLSVPSVMVDGQPNLLEVLRIRGQELFQPRSLLLPIRFQAWLDGFVHSFEG
jgi:hypothetical protein